MAKRRAIWSIEMLDPFFGGFEEFLTARGASPLNLHYRLRATDLFGDWMKASGRTLESIDEASVDEFMRRQVKPLYKSTTMRGWLTPLLAYLRSVERIPARVPETPPVAGSAERYLQAWSRFLLEERGLGATSVSHHVHFGRIFLSWFGQEAPLRLEERVTADSVTAFILSRRAQVPVGSAANEASLLRSLLRFLHAQGLVGDLAGIVPSVRSRRDSGVPKVLATEAVEGITREIGAFPRTHYRNLAMLALVSNLGLRAHEVTDLLLEDIDWRAGTVQIRGKGGFRDSMPLPVEVGEALSDYLEHDTHRGPGERHLFHTAIGFFGPISASSLKGAVQDASRRAGHGPTGPHRFRHTLASRTLNAGASMEEVSQLLRHRSLTSTTIYAKVDFERLGQVARPWPGPTSMAREEDAS